MTIKNRWSRMVRKSGSSGESASTTASNASMASSTTSSSGGFLAKTFSWRSSKSSTHTTGTHRSDRGIGSISSGAGSSPGTQHASNKNSVGNAVDGPHAGQSKNSNNLPPLEASAQDNDGQGYNYINMSESQRHQARLSAYKIKFGASRPMRSDLDDISPCNSRRVSMDSDYY